MASAPRKILRLPSMWAMTKPTSTRPVTAITTFLPTTVLQSTTAGLLDQTRRALRTDAGFGRPVALPLSNWVAIRFLRAAPGWRGPVPGNSAVWQRMKRLILIDLLHPWVEGGCNLRAQDAPAPAQPSPGWKVI